MKIAMGIVAGGLLAAMPVTAQEPPPTSGPFAVVMEMDPTLLGHTVYRPRAMQDVKPRQLPVIAFGNGGCINDGSLYHDLLSEVASYGFLVVATGPIVPRDQPADSDTVPGQLTETLNWAQEQNLRSDSKFYGKLDMKAIGLMGHSCGGRQALAASGDARVKTTVVLNSGVSDLNFSGGDIGQKVLDRLHAPLLYMSGGPSDQAYRAVEGDFQNISKLPVFKADRDAGHNATYFQPHGGVYGMVVTAWLQWQLQGDGRAGAQFQGASCGLCTEAPWRIARKNIE